MRSTTIILLTLGGSVAAIDWWAVASNRRGVELIAKPLTLVLLIAAAVAIEPATPSVRAWFVVALILSLAGDIFLMLSRDMFVAGLGSFLLAHLAYVAGFLQAPMTSLAVVGVAGALIGVAVFGRQIHQAAAASDRRLAIPVAAYIGAISLMLVTAYATANLLAAVGATLFLASDTVLGWNRFVRPIPNGRLLTIVTYHAAQVLLVLSLLTL